MNQFDKFLGVFLIHPTRRIEPDQFYRPILRRNLVHLRIAFLPKIIVKCFRMTGCVHLGTSISAGISPILILRIIEAKTDPRFLTGFRELNHRITFKIGRLNNIKRIHFRMKHRKSIVMFARNHDIAHPRIFCKLYDRLSVKMIWMK